tara:strand:- start:175 stop:357 length:183 start_codon:yes stop_codon:yes gene_type:complete
MAKEGAKGSTPDGFDLDWADRLTEDVKEKFGKDISVASIAYIMYQTMQKLGEDYYAPRDN